MSRDIRITMSGKTYSAAVEGSSVPTEEGWPTPKVVRVGNGHRIDYAGITRHEAELILSHLDECAECLSGGGVDGGAADARAIRRDAARIREVLAVQS